MPLSGEFGHTPVVGNSRRCGCGAVGCLETLVSERGLLESFGTAQAASGQTRRTPSVPRPSPARTEQDGAGAVTNWGAASTSEGPRLESGRGSLPAWKDLVSNVADKGIEPWLSETLDATARIIAGALNVLGLHRVIVTGRLTELAGGIDYLAAGVNKGAMWGRFGHVTCQSAPHRRAAGLVAAGIDRLILPTGDATGTAPLLLQNQLSKMS